MKKISILALTMCSAMASAAEKAPSMEDMWKIIQQQQKTIEALHPKNNIKSAT